MRIRTLIIWIFVSSFGLMNPLFAEDETGNSCEYLWKLDQCINANRNGTALSIQDFVCIESRDSSRILDQIILDEKFWVIDAEIELFLDDMRSNKQAVVDDQNIVIDDIASYLTKEWYYYKQYKALCNGWILSERMSCWEVIPNIIGAEYLDGGSYDGRSCISLVNIKMDIYNQVAGNIISQNKSKVPNDLKKLFRQEEKNRYNALDDLQIAILWSAERMANGITHFTPYPKQAYNMIKSDILVVVKKVYSWI